VLLVDAKILFDIYGSALAEHSAVYCSVPVSSGRRFVDWATANSQNHGSIDSAQASEADAHLQYVIRPNCAAAARLVERLRREYAAPVVNPAELPTISGWRQTDYRQFWLEFIGRFVQTVVMAEGWEYSIGCCYEFLHAHTLSLNVVDESGTVLPLSKGLSMIERGMKELQRVTHNDEGIEGVLANVNAARSAQR
jgi:hypothetical protein